MSAYHLLSMVARTAAKPHRCIWCGEYIEKGERYQDERSVFDGHMQHHRWHPECLEDAQEGWRAGDDAEFIPHNQDRPERATQ